jgi:hypothetical protein
MGTVTHGLALFLAFVAGYTSTASAASTTWHFNGITYPFERGLNAADVPHDFFNLPAHTPVGMDVTFDPSIPNSSSFYNEAQYRFSGGDTSLRIQLGTHGSAPIDKFRMLVFQNGDRDINEILLVGYDPGNGVDLPFLDISKAATS